MINQKIYNFIIILILMNSYAFGQISPGPLSAAHAGLEGISNCTQCHDLGNKVPDQKCLECHKEINELVKAKKGYHASKDVTSKNCVTCHNDHHGRKFDMIRFEENDFDHLLAGYELKGQHKVIDCRECHKPELISDPKIAKLKDTYLGLKDDCLTCHSDFHQETLSKNCVECHGFDAFRPTVGFNHNDADFKLRGRHTDISCVECHPKTTKNGKEFQQFTGIEFTDCKSCHDNPHSQNIPGSCVQCHVESSFETFKGQKSFNHNLTDFELLGSHKTVNCFDCHKNTRDAKSIFQDKKGIQENNCVSCHDDVHNGKFGNDCAKCHSEVRFTDLKSMDFFDHNLTDYPLEGQHIPVDCKSCHTGKFTDEINFSACNNCHSDYHKKQFTNKNANSDCINCHSLREKFTFTTFGFEEHDLSEFPLEGAHLATPCFACHISEERWEFRDIGESCVDCHDNIHRDYISEKYYPESNCKLCHNAENWSEISNFDHSNTNWNLVGKHKEVSCNKCHFEINNVTQKKTQQFKNLSFECSKCHENIHGTQFEEKGVTDCKKCHTSEDWDPVNFNHDRTDFPLTGKHAEIECKACHKKDDSNSSDSKINYKIKKFECIDCHS